MFPPASTAPGALPPKRKTLAQFGQPSALGPYQKSTPGGVQPIGAGPTPSATGASPHVAALGTGSTHNPLIGTIPQAPASATPAAPTPTAPTAPAAPQGFAGMNPAGTIDPQQAKSQIEAALGFALSPEQLQEAIGVSGWNGSGPFTGAHYNAVMQAAASRTGNRFSPYTDPAQAAPGAAPNPQDQYNRAPLQLPVSDAPPLNVADIQLPNNFAAPTYHAPADFEAARFTRQDPFKAPTMEDAENDPGYAFGLRESIRAIENSKAAGGALRTPGARDAIIQRAGDFATQRYGDVYNRRVGEHGMERQGNLDEYGAAREGGIDQYDRRTDAARFGQQVANEGLTEEFNRGVDLGTTRDASGFRNTIAEYEPGRATWDARTNADQRAAEVNYDGDWQSRLFGVDDQYRRQRDTVNDQRYREQFNRDDQRFNRADWWQQQQFAEQRRQYLASLGLSAS